MFKPVSRLPSLHNASAAATLLSLGDTGCHGGKSTFCLESGEPGPNALTSVCVQSLSCVRLFVAPWTAARQASLSFTISQSLVKFTSIELVMLSNRFIQYPGNNSQDISLNLFLESVTTIGNLHTSQEKSACRRRCPCPVQRGQAAAARATHPGKSHAGYCLTHLCAPLVYLQPDPVYGRHTKFCPITD